ncbi:MAG: hypothetical protein K2H66_00520 [Oscillospiraceae bacterium]|nr:hypothetical protein [Oscillospiraceae bacterium]
MSDEMKARSFRTTDAIAEKFRAICNDFPNQNTALESLINAYEVQNASVVLTDRQTDITDYNSHIQALQAAFLHSLEITENTENRIRIEFQKQLDSKENTIISLQDLVNELENRMKTADERIVTVEADAQARIATAEKISQSLRDELDRAEQKIAEQEKAIKAKNGIITDKETIITSLRVELDTAKKAAESVPTLENRVETAENSLVAAQREIEKLNQKLTDEKEKAEQMANLAAERAEIALQKAVLAEQKAAAESAKQTTEEVKKLYAEISKLKNEISELKNKKILNANAENKMITSDINDNN